MPNIPQFLSDARTQTRAISTGLGGLTDRLSQLPDGLRGEVAAAIESTRAATNDAQAALAAVSAWPDERAVVELLDAQVALDAAFAQVRYVAQLAATRDERICAQLRELQGHLDRLRGKTPLRAWGK